MKEEGRRDIAFLGFRGGPGGISNVMLNLINSCARLGFSVDLLLNNPDIPELARVDRGIRRVRLGRATGLPSSRRLAAYLSEARPKAILTNRERANRALALALRMSSHRPKVVFRVGMPVSTALERRGPLKRRLRQWSMKAAYGAADLVIANSHKVAEDLVRWIGVDQGRIEVLPNPTVSPDLKTLASDECGHPWFALGEPVILGIGRLARQKDFHTLIRAFHTVVQRRPARLVILGEGKERSALEELVRSLGLEERVDMPGFVSNPFSYLSRASLFVLSSAWEGSPNVLIEALAVGTPVVSTDCPSGPREILQDGRFGPLVEVGDVSGMAGAMERMLASPVSKELLKAAAAPFQALEATRRYLEVIGLYHG